MCTISWSREGQFTGLAIGLHQGKHLFLYVLSVAAVIHSVTALQQGLPNHFHKVELPYESVFILADCIGIFITTDCSVGIN